MAEQEKQKENLVNDNKSSSDDGYSSDSSLYSSSDMFGFDTESSESDDESMEPIYSSELAAIKAAAKPDAPVNEEFIRSLMQEQKGKALMPIESPKKKKPDTNDLDTLALVADSTKGRNKGIVIRENPGKTKPDEPEEAAKKAKSAVKLLQDFWKGAHEVRVRPTPSGGVVGGGADDGKRARISPPSSPPPSKKAKMISLEEYTEKVKQSLLDESQPVPESADVFGLKSDLGEIDIEELMNKGKEYRNDMYAKVLVQLLKRMPVVITRGGVREGELTKGFLFKLEPIVGAKIVCTCHGEFFNTAEFVAHAGGDPDVPNPTKFIHIEFF